MVKVDLGVAKAQVSSIKKVCNALNDQVDQIQDAVEEFIDNDSLKGKGYQGAKEFGATVVINAWRAVRVAFEAVGKGADQMIKEYESSVDTKSWSDKELEDKIKTLQCDKAQLSAQITALQDLTKMVSQNKGDTDNLNKTIQASNQAVGTLDDQINHFKQIKQHLDEFSTKSSRFMNDAQSLISEAMTGISELNSGLNPQTGECVLPDSGQLTWLNDVNAKADKYDSRKEQFIDMMSDTYGIDESHAKDLYALQNGIEKYAKKHHKDGEWAVYEFNRLVASLGGYGINKTDNVKNDILKSFQWSQAGCVSVLEAVEISKKYTHGLDDKDLETLSSYLTNQQHNGFSEKSDLAHESVIIASHLTQEMSSCDPNHKMNDCDFVLTRLAGMGINSKNHKIESDFDDNVSYRGDVKSGIQQASNRDLESDVDADNVCARVQNAKNIRQAMNEITKYNTGIAKGKVDRKKEFLGNHGGWDSVKEKIDSWTPEDVMLSKDVTQSDIQAAKKSFKKYLDTKKTGFEALFN